MSFSASQFTIMETICSIGSISISSFGLIDVGVRIPSSGKTGELMWEPDPLNGLRSADGDFEPGVNGRLCSGGSFGIFASCRGFLAGGGTNGGFVGDELLWIHSFELTRLNFTRRALALFFCSTNCFYSFKLFYLFFILNKEKKRHNRGIYLKNLSFIYLFIL